MITVVIPTLNAEATLGQTLAALVSAAVDGLVREVIVVDGGSSDRTAEIVDHAGANLVTRQRGPGPAARRRRRAGTLPLAAVPARGHGAGARLGARGQPLHGARRSWAERPLAAAAFRFALDDEGARPRVLERLVALRCAALRLPYGDQGLLIPKRLYDEVGGYRPLALMEDVDLVRRLGRRRTVMLRTRAVTSAERFRREGYVAPLRPQPALPHALHAARARPRDQPHLRLIGLPRCSIKSP